MSSDLLAPEIVADLVGVIDLKAGRAVHGVAGQRAHYKPASFGDRQKTGDAVGLANHYRQLGIQRLYIADLDSLVDGTLQRDWLDRLVDNDLGWHEIIIDVGWRPDDRQLVDFVGGLVDRSPISRVIVATESAGNTESLKQLVDTIDSGRAFIGLDYRDGVFINESSSESTWIESAIKLNIKSAVVLDVATVGTGDCNTAVSLCRQIKREYPELLLYSGGGIRSSADVVALRSAGCEYCLAATSLHPLQARPA